MMHLGHNPASQTDKIENKRKVVQDHLGNWFSSEREMAEAHGVTYTVYAKRKSRGKSISECLTPKTITDHTGAVYKSVSEMCKAYDVSPYTYYSRRARGMNLHDCLSGRDTAKNKCAKAKIRYGTYCKRKQAGMSEFEALTTPVKKCKIESVDHKGIEYASISEMCRAYGIKPQVYDGRVRNGWSLGAALTTPVRTANHARRVEYNGVEYASLRELCRTLDVNTSSVCRKLAAGVDIETAVATTRRRGFARKGIK